MRLLPPPKPNRDKQPFVATFKVEGLPRILIETKAGQLRKWRGGSRRLGFHYGEFEGTLGTDGDPVDVYLGPLADEPGRVYVVHQKRQGTRKYDEDKVMLGWPTRAEAIKAYREQYDSGGFYAGCSTWGLAEFAAALPTHRGRPLIREGGLDRFDLVKGRQVELFIRPHVRGGRVISAHRRVHRRRDEVGPAAPQPGQKGYRPPEPDRPGSGSYDAASLVMDAARRLLEDPHLGAVMADEYGVFGSADIPDLLSVPLSIEGVDLTSPERASIAHVALNLAAATRDRRYAAELESRAPHATRMVEGVDVALLADALHELTTGKPPSGRLVDVPIDEAMAFVRAHHSQLPEVADRGILFALGLERGRRLVAVALAGTPTGRWADPHSVLELYRVASDGTRRNAASQLTARMIDLVERAARDGAQTPPRLVTYSLAGEPGTPYRALRDKGLRPTALVRGRAGRQGARGGAGDSALRAATKIRWEAGPGAGPARWDLLEEVQDAVDRRHGAGGAVRLAKGGGVRVRAHVRAGKPVAAHTRAGGGGGAEPGAAARRPATPEERLALIRREEARIAGEAHEHAFGITPDGHLLGRQTPEGTLALLDKLLGRAVAEALGYTDTTRYCALPQEWATSIDTMVHNHPTGTPWSPLDLELCGRMGWKVSRVCGKLANGGILAMEVDTREVADPAAAFGILARELPDIAMVAHFNVNAAAGTFTPGGELTDKGKVVLAETITRIFRGRVAGLRAFVEVHDGEMPADGAQLRLFKGGTFGRASVRPSLRPAAHRLSELRARLADQLAERDVEVLIEVDDERPMLRARLEDLAKVKGRRLSVIVPSKRTRWPDWTWVQEHQARVVVPLSGSTVRALLSASSHASRVFVEGWTAAIDVRRTPASAARALVERKGHPLHLRGLTVGSPRWPAWGEFVVDGATTDNLGERIDVPSVVHYRATTTTRREVARKLGPMGAEVFVPVSGDLEAVRARPELWLSRLGLARVAVAAGLDREEQRRWTADPRGYLADPLAAAGVEYELDAAWAAWLHAEGWHG